MGQEGGAVRPAIRVEGGVERLRDEALHGPVRREPVHGRRRPVDAGDRAADVDVRGAGLRREDQHMQGRQGMRTLHAGGVEQLRPARV